MYEYLANIKLVIYGDVAIYKIATCLNHIMDVCTRLILVCFARRRFSRNTNHLAIAQKPVHVGTEQRSDLTRLERQSGSITALNAEAPSTEKLILTTIAHGNAGDYLLANAQSAASLLSQTEGIVRLLAAIIKRESKGSALHAYGVSFSIIVLLNAVIIAPDFARRNAAVHTESVKETQTGEVVEVIPVVRIGQNLLRRSGRETATNARSARKNKARENLMYIT